MSLKEDWAVSSRRHSTVSKFLSLSQYGHDGREGGTDKVDPAATSLGFGFGVERFIT